MLNYSVTYIFCAMRIFKKALHSKIDVFVKFESAINLEIRGQIKKKMYSFYLGYKDHMYALSSKSGSEPFRFALFWGDLRWNDPCSLSEHVPNQHSLHTQYQPIGL